MKHPLGTTMTPPLVMILSPLMTLSLVTIPSLVPTQEKLPEETQVAIQEGMVGTEILVVEVGTTMEMAGQAEVVPIVQQRQRQDPLRRVRANP